MRIIAPMKIENVMPMTIFFGALGTVVCWFAYQGVLWLDPSGTFTSAVKIAILIAVVTVPTMVARSASEGYYWVIPVLGWMSLTFLAVPLSWYVGDSQFGWYLVFLAGMGAIMLFLVGCLIQDS